MTRHWFPRGCLFSLRGAAFNTKTCQARGFLCPLFPSYPPPLANTLEVSLTRRARLVGSSQHVISWVDLSELSVVLLLVAGCCRYYHCRPQLARYYFLLPCFSSPLGHGIIHTIQTVLWGMGRG